MTLRADLRLAVRGLRRAPLFAAVAILSLGLGIGANAAIFTLLDQLLLRRLDVTNPDQLVMVYQDANNMGSNSGSRMNSYPLYQDLQKRAEPFADALCRRIGAASVSVGQQTERVQAELVSGNYFTMLGVKPAAGRVFSPDQDDQVVSGHPVVVLSYPYWVSRFAKDPAAVGQVIRVNDTPMTIVGVSEESFLGLDPSRAPQLRVPIKMQPEMMRESAGWLKMDDRRAKWVQVFARLKPGYTLESAQAPLQGLYTQIRTDEMTLPAAKDWSAYAREGFMKGKIVLTSAAGGYSPLRNDVSTALVVLMCMVGLVLLIACANVANLLIARGFMRQKEVALRLSLGASRGQLVTQFLMESLLLAGLGAIVGLALAFWLTQGLLAFVPVEGTPLLLSARPDWRVLAFTGVLSMATAVVFGLLPALGASRPDPWRTLKEAMTTIAGSGGSLVLRKGLVAAQVALSFLLLFGAGLFVRSLQNLKTTDAGLAIDNLVAFQVAPILSGYDTPRGVQFYNGLLERLRADPSIESAGVASMALLAGNEWDSSISVEGHTPQDGEDMQGFMNQVTPGYFKTMKIKLLEGRDFTPADAVPEPHVAIVNEKLAKHYFPGVSAVGKRIGMGGRPGTPLNVEIIGVVADSLYEGPREGVRRQVFWPGPGGAGSAVIYMRTRTASTASYEVARRKVAELDATMPVYGVKTVESQLDETLLTDRLVATLSAGFGLLATFLAAIGLYGVMAFVVARRRKELGIRIALGASAGSVQWMVIREVLLLLGIGLLVGVPAALGLGGYLSSQLYGLQPRDPVVAVTMVALLATASILAGFIPALRASRIDPIGALRHE
jgi:predicted permease